MIRISRFELFDLEKIGQGHLSMVFKLDDENAYKIYFSEIPARNYYGKEHRMVDNPCLRYNKSKYKLLKRKEKKLQYTDIFKDIIFVDDRFYGVQIPFYDGLTLYDCLNNSFDSKMDISKQLIRNCDELTSNFIYPRDLSLRNVMLVDGNVKIIDLDDPTTKVCHFSNILYKTETAFALNGTIMSLFQESEPPFCYDSVYSYVERKTWFIKNNSKFIHNYLDYKNQVSDYLIISEDSDLNFVREVNKDGQYRMLYKFKCDPESYNTLSNIAIDHLINRIPLFDFVNQNRIDSYFNNFNEGETYEVFNQTLVKRKKKESH